MNSQLIEVDCISRSIGIIGNTVIEGKVGTMSAVTISPKFQVVIPNDVREKMKLAK